MSFTVRGSILRPSQLELSVCGLLLFKLIWLDTFQMNASYFVKGDMCLFLGCWITNFDFAVTRSFILCMRIFYCSIPFSLAAENEIIIESYVTKNTHQFKMPHKQRCKCHWQRYETNIYFMVQSKWVSGLPMAHKETRDIFFEHIWYAMLFLMIKLGDVFGFCHSNGKHLSFRFRSSEHLWQRPTFHTIILFHCTGQWIRIHSTNRKHCKPSLFNTVIVIAIANKCCSE